MTECMVTVAQRFFFGRQLVFHVLLIVRHTQQRGLFLFGTGFGGRSGLLFDFCAAVRCAGKNRVLALASNRASWAREVPRIWCVQAPEHLTQQDSEGNSQEAVGNANGKAQQAEVRAKLQSDQGAAEDYSEYAYLRCNESNNVVL